MPPFKDRLSDEAITGVIASFKNLWSNEHRRRHDRHGSDDAHYRNNASRFSA
jgi:hypothetical protein